MMPNVTRVPNVLSIAGSDPSGGAGVQADLKTFAALGTYGMAVITALTAQNTRGIRSVHLAPAECVIEQTDAIFDDVRVDAVKVGMVGGVETARAIADVLERRGARNVVIDPVMAAKGGHVLLEHGAVDVIRDRLLPLAAVVTPNLPEAGALLDENAPSTVAEMREAAQALHARGARAVYLKGGHLAGDRCVDVFFDGEALHELPEVRIGTQNSHGTGCTLSSAIAAFLARGATLPEAAGAAKAYVTAALAMNGELSVGGGHGPLHHFYALWRDDVPGGVTLPTGSIRTTERGLTLEPAP